MPKANGQHQRLVAVFAVDAAAEPLHEGLPLQLVSIYKVAQSR